MNLRYTKYIRGHTRYRTEIFAAWFSCYASACSFLHHGMLGHVHNQRQMFTCQYQSFCHGQGGEPFLPEFALEVCTLYYAIVQSSADGLNPDFLRFESTCMLCACSLKTVNIPVRFREGLRDTTDRALGYLPACAAPGEKTT